MGGHIHAWRIVRDTLVQLCLLLRLYCPVYTPLIKRNLWTFDESRVCNTNFAIWNWPASLNTFFLLIKDCSDENINITHHVNTKYGGLQLRVFFPVHARAWVLFTCNWNLNLRIFLISQFPGSHVKVQVHSRWALHCTCTCSPSIFDIF